LVKSVESPGSGFGSAFSNTCEAVIFDHVAIMASSLFSLHLAVTSYCRWSHLPTRIAFGSVVKRYLTSAEVSTALRPFYFLVHPDLFGRFPDERATNEKSLKHLRSYVDTMVAERKRPKPVTLKFYLRPADRKISTAKCQQQHLQGRAALRTVMVKLDEATPREAVRAVLKGVALPTSYVDSIPGQEGATADVFHEGQHEENAFTEVHSLFRQDYRPSTDTRTPLAEWLEANADTARERIERALPMALRAERLQDEMCAEFGLENVIWDCGWDKDHRPALLNSFGSVVADHKKDVAPIIAGRTIVFGRYSGVSLDGDIVLYAGEVRRNWLNVIKKAKEADGMLRAVPASERSLSQSLRGIKVVRRINQPITLVEDYRLRLRQLLTAIGDYRSRRDFPPDWPRDMSQFKMCVETEASPLTLTPDGIFVVPASCPAFLLAEFVGEHAEEALRRARTAEEDSAREAPLVARCSKELGLLSLDRADGVDQHSMIECCVRLLQSAHLLRHLTHGNSLQVAKYYSVAADGTVCIPWNWVE